MVGGCPDAGLVHRRDALPGEGLAQAPVPGVHSRDHVLPRLRVLDVGAELHQVAGVIDVVVQPRIRMEGAVPAERRDPPLEQRVERPVDLGTDRRGLHLRGDLPERLAHADELVVDEAAGGLAVVRSGGAGHEGEVAGVLPGLVERVDPVRLEDDQEVEPPGPVAPFPMLTMRVMGDSLVPM